MRVPFLPHLSACGVSVRPALVLWLAAGCAGVSAQGVWSTAAAVPAQAQAAAEARLQADQRLCDALTETASRQTCLDHARADFEQAMGRPRSAPGVYATQSRDAATDDAPACPQCARVVAVRRNEQPGQGDAVGMVAGGVAGALIGRQFGSGTGRDLATVAGAAAGAYAGKKVQEHLTQRSTWTVSVEYTQGGTADFQFDQDPGLKVGDRVRNEGASVVRY